MDHDDIIFTYAEVNLSGFETVHINVIHDKFVVSLKVTEADASEFDQYTVHASLTYLPSMASQLKSLYEELGRSFFSKPSDLKKCVVLLSKLKVCSLLNTTTWLALILPKIGLIEAGLLLPQGDVNLGDLVVARSYLN